MKEREKEKERERGIPSGILGLDEIFCSCLKNHNLANRRIFVHQATIDFHKHKLSFFEIRGILREVEKSDFGHFC